MHTYQGRRAGLKAAQNEAKTVAKARAECEPIYEMEAETGTNGTCPALSPKQAAELERDSKGTDKPTKEETMKKRMQRAELIGVLRKSGTGTWTLNHSGQTGQSGTNQTLSRP